MDRTNDLIDLGAATVETKGPDDIGRLDSDPLTRFDDVGISDD